MANLTIFPLSYFVSKRYFQQCRKQNQILKSPTYVLTVFSKSYQFPYFKTFKVSMILVHKSANFTVHIFFYCFTGFTPLVGFLDVICSSVGFAYRVIHGCSNKETLLSVSLRSISLSGVFSTEMENLIQ